MIEVNFFFFFFFLLCAQKEYRMEARVVNGFGWM